MPIVTVWPTPNGSPIASTRSPTCKLVAVAEIDGRKLFTFGVDLQHRQIGAGIGEKHPRLELTLVGERDHDVLTALDHMVVGENDAIGTHDHAGTQRLLHALTELRRYAEEALKERIVEQRVHRRLHDAARIDVDDSRRHALDDRRESQLHLRHRLRNGARCAIPLRPVTAPVLSARQMRQRKTDSISSIAPSTHTQKGGIAAAPYSNCPTCREDYSSLSESSSPATGPESSPLASSSRSTNSMIAIGGIVAIAETGLQHAGIAARTRRIARTDHVEQLPDLVDIPDLGERLAAGVQIGGAAARQGHELLDRPDEGPSPSAAWS